MHDDIRKTHVPLPHLSIDNDSFTFTIKKLKITIKNDGDADSHICYVDFYDCSGELALNEQTLSDMRLVRRIPISVVSGGTTTLSSGTFWYFSILLRHFIAVVYDPILDPIDFNKIDQNRHFAKLEFNSGV